MKKNRFAGRSVAVLGFGREGLEAVRLMLRLGALVTVLDSQAARALGKDGALLRKRGVGFRLGKEHLNNLTDFEIIIRSPGVALNLPELKKAVRLGVELTSSTELFFELAPTKKIIGVTGTKGKSTTASLIYHLLLGKTKRVYLAGNIGRSPLALLSKLTTTDIVVLELSSFQLEDLKVSPWIAVLLQVVPEHLDRHKTFAKYLSAKLNIVNYQKKTDWLVTSKDFSSTKLVAKSARAKILPVSGDQVLRRGVYVAAGEIIYREPTTGRRQVVASLADIKLRGSHVTQNVLPAIGAAILAGLPVGKVAHRLATFKGLPHRLQTIRVIRKTTFVNDSYATTPEAAAAAVTAFADRPMAVLVGGIYKGGDIKVLAKAINRSPVVFIGLFGRSARKFKTIFGENRVTAQMVVFASFERAVAGAYNRVRGEGVVLLSPACSSFDMFKNATDRAETFKRIVAKLT